MTGLAELAPFAIGRTWWAVAWMRAPALVVAAVFLLAMLIPTLALWALDTRFVDGQRIWLKPLKFELAVGVYLATLAVMAVWLPKSVVEAQWFTPYVWMLVAAAALEMIWIIAAATLGLRSHFNTTQPFLAAIYPLMGLIAIALTSGVLVFGLAIWSADEPAMPAVVRLSVGLGGVLTFALTVWIAGALAAGPPTRTLRGAHFLATHAIHALPAVGVLAAQTVPTRTGQAIIWASAVAYTAAITILFARA